MATIPQTYEGTFLARPAEIINCPELINRAAYLNSSDTIDNRTLWERTLIALPLGAPYPHIPLNPIDPTTIHFLDLTAISSDSPLPHFPNLRAIHVRAGTAFVPAPTVIHSIDAGNPLWRINPGLIPKTYNTAEYERIQRVVLIVRARTGADLVASNLDVDEWIDALGELSRAVAQGTRPGHKDKRNLQLVLRIIVDSPEPTPPPPNWNPRYSALVKIATAVAGVLPDVELILDGPGLWDMGWLGFNFFAQRESYDAAYRYLATLVARTQLENWPLGDIRTTEEVWIKQALLKRLTALLPGEYKSCARVNGVWEFEASCR